MTPISITYKEAGLLLPATDNRQVLHGKVFTAISDARKQRTERDYIFSVKESHRMKGQALVNLRALDFPAAVPSAEKTITFEVGKQIQCLAQLVTTAQIPGERYRYRERRADEIRSWLDDLLARHGFRVDNATWSNRESYLVKRGNTTFRIPSLWCQFDLTVEDAEKAASAWVNGIGRKKGYGFGMLEKSNASL
jgi:hypothetical protein